MVGLRRRHLVAQLQPDASLALSATATLNAEAHANRTLLLTGDGSTLQTYTLPAASGSGNKYKFLIQTTNTGTYVVGVNGTDEMNGNVIGGDDSDEDTCPGWVALAADNFTTFTTGTVAQGELGSWFEFIDDVSGVWFVHGIIVQSGNSEVTPFS